MIALFGLAIFQLHLFAPFSFTAVRRRRVRRSFIAAGAMMSLIALPPLFTATRDGLQAVPAHMREAAFALGKTRIATIRRVLLPSVRSNIATGVTLGVSRIIGDTAIVVLLLGETLRLESAGLGARSSGCCAAPARRSRATSMTTRRPAKARRRRRPTRPRSCCWRSCSALNLIVDRIGRSQADATGLTVAGAIV